MYTEILRIIDVDEDFGDNDKELKEALLGKYQGNEKQKEKSD